MGFSLTGTHVIFFVASVIVAGSGSQRVKVITNNGIADYYTYTG